MQGTLHVWQLALHRRIPVILNRVISSTFKNFSDLGPLVIHNTMHEEENPLFLLIPVDFFNTRIEMIVPSFATLLSYSAVEVLRYKGPLLRTIGHHELEDAPIFFGSPSSLDIKWLALPSYSLLG